MRPTTRAAATAVVMLLLTAGCGTEDADPTDTSSPSPSRPPTSSTGAATPGSQPAPAGPVDVPSLPRGADPEVDHVVDQTLHVDGRVIATDLPEDASVGVMGVVDDLVVVSGTVGISGLSVYWSVDPAGHAERLGEGDYDTYSYAPVLVEETGHLWLNYDDRGTGAVTIWALDVRTGEELLELHGDDEPPALEPADQEAYDLFRGRGEVPPEPPATSPDGTLVAVMRADPEGGDTETLVVRRAPGGRGSEVVAEVAFASGDRLSDRDERLQDCPDPGGDCYLTVLVGAPHFEDDEHVLVLVGISVSDGANVLEPVEQDAMVRCDLDGACELATDLVGSVSF